MFSSDILADYTGISFSDLCKAVRVVKLLPLETVSLKKFSKWRLLVHVKIRGRVLGWLVKRPMKLLSSLHNTHPGTDFNCMHCTLEYIYAS